MSEIRIISKHDPTCKMYSVYIDRRHKQLPKKLLMSGMEGNYWDFHPGCHGLFRGCDWRGRGGLISILKNRIVELGHVPIVISKKYSAM